MINCSSATKPTASTPTPTALPGALIRWENRPRGHPEFHQLLRCRRRRPTSRRPIFPSLAQRADAASKQPATVKPRRRSVAMTVALWVRAQVQVLSRPVGPATERSLWIRRVFPGLPDSARWWVLGIGPAVSVLGAGSSAEDCGGGHGFVSVPWAPRVRPLLALIWPAEGGCDLL